MPHYLKSFLSLLCLLIMGIAIYAPYEWGAELYDEELRYQRTMEVRGAAQRDHYRDRLETIRRQYPFQERGWIWESGRREGQAPGYLTIRRKLDSGQVVAEGGLAILVAGLLSLGFMWREKQRNSTTALSVMAQENEGLKLMIMMIVAKPGAVPGIDRALRQIMADTPRMDREGKLAIASKGVSDLAQKILTRGDLKDSIQNAMLEMSEDEDEA